MSDPIFHRAHRAHYANLMINYMVAKELQWQNPGLRLSNFDMDYWNIFLPEIEASEHDRIARFGREQHLDFRSVNYLLKNRVVNRIEWSGYGQRLEYFPELSRAREMFVRNDIEPTRVDAGHLLCPVRAQEVLAGIHRGYPIVPIDFYTDMVERTGLTPVFMGQTGDNIYVSALKRRFPTATFLPHVSAIHDFQMIRAATNLLIPVSTFAWLAAWLSNAESIIYPAFGMLNPQSFRSHNLLPLNDNRYQIWLFPHQAAVPENRLFEAHESIRGQWSAVTPRELLRAFFED
jgi:hypothetical protein